jgi:hypothetical protein
MLWIIDFCWARIRRLGLRRFAKMEVGIWIGAFSFLLHYGYWKLALGGADLTLKVSIDCILDMNLALDILLV